MMLPALELLEGAHVGIAVVEVGDQAQVDLVVFSVVEKGAAAGAGFAAGANPGREPPGPRRAVPRVNLPDLLDTDTVVLRVLAGIQ